MQITCPHCSSSYSVASERIPPQGVSIKCPSCSQSFEVHPPSAPASKPTTPGFGTGIPLPGQGTAAPAAAGGIPLPGQGAPSGIPFPATPPAGSIPLPGQAATPTGGGIPLPGQGAPSGIPLPGQGAPSGIPFPATPAAGSIPLPGQGAPSGIPLPGQGAPSGIPLPGQGAPSGISLPGQENVPEPNSTLSFGAFIPPAQEPPLPPPSQEGEAIPNPFGAPMPQAANISAFDAPDASPFHGNNSIVVSDPPAASGIDFINQGAPKSGAISYRIRKRAGNISGPFDENTVLQMFASGQLNGSEEVSTDNFKWNPIAQVPAFAQTVQSAMAQALEGLGDEMDLPALRSVDVDLPTPAGADLPTPVQADLPTPVQAGLPTPVQPPMNVSGAPTMAPPQPQHANLPTPKIDLGAPIQSQPAPAAPGPKAKKPKKEKKKKEGGGSKLPIFAALGGIVLLAVAGAGAYTHFMTEHGAFGYKTLMAKYMPSDEVPKQDPKPPKKVVVEKKTPPPLEENLSASILLEKDDYVPYFQGAQGFKKVVDRSKGKSPVPKSARDAAAEAARMNAYLVVVEKMDAARKDLSDMVPLASEENEARLIGEVGLAYAAQNYDKGLELIAQALKGEKAPQAAALAEVKAWESLGLQRKTEYESALTSVNEALNADASRLFAMYQNASILVDSGQFEKAQKQIDSILSKSKSHTRTLLLQADLFALDPDKKKQARTILKTLAESGGDTAAAPQRARAYFGLAQLDVAESEWDAAAASMNKGLELVPNNRQFLREHAEFSLQMREFDDAIASYEKIRAAFPGDKSVGVGLARARIGKGETQAAYQAMEEAAKKNPEDAVLAFWFGEAARRHTKSKVAVAQFQKAQKLDPKYAAPLVALAQDALEKGDIKGAMKVLKDTDEIRVREMHEIHSARAKALFRGRKLKAARSELSLALKSDPRSTDARLLSVLINIEEGKLKSAAKEAKLVSSLEPRNPRVIATQGLVKALQKGLKEGLGDFERATTLAPNDAELYLLASQAALANEEPARAKGFVDQAETLKRDTPAVMVARALVLKTSDPQLAVQTLKDALEKEPDNPRISYQIGLTYQVMNRHLEAKDSFKDTLKKDPGFLDAQFALARSYREMGRDSFARSTLKKLLKKDKRRTDAWVALAQMDATSGNTKLALRSLDQAVKYSPNAANAVCDRGMMLVRQMGDSKRYLKSGVKSLERCVTLMPKHNGAWLALGDAYRDLNSKAKAVRAYKKHARIVPAEAATVCETLQGLGATCE